MGTRGGGIPATVPGRVGWPGARGLEQRGEGYSRSSFSCWEKGYKNTIPTISSPVGSEYIKLGILPLAETKT